MPIQKKRIEEEQSGSDRSERFSPSGGKNNIRLIDMPMKDNPKKPNWPFFVRYLHYVEVPGEENKKVVVCPRLNHKGDMASRPECPMCDAADDARSNGDTKGHYNLRASLAKMANLIDRKDGQLYTWHLPIPLQKAIDGFHQELEEGDPDIGDWMRGYDLVFTVAGTGRKRKYEGITVARKATPVIPAIKKEGKNKFDWNGMLALIEAMDDFDFFEKATPPGMIQAFMDGEDYDSSMEADFAKSGDDDDDIPFDEPGEEAAETSTPDKTDPVDDPVDDLDEGLDDLDGDSDGDTTPEEDTKAEEPNDDFDEDFGDLDSDDPEEHPKCFANATVYDMDNNDDCLRCPSEGECSIAISKAAKVKKTKAVKAEKAKAAKTAKAKG